MKQKLTAAVLAGVIGMATITSVSANPNPPTNGGNGAGQSGQCTGAAADRPASCQSK